LISADASFSEFVNAPLVLANTPEIETATRRATARTWAESNQRMGMACLTIRAVLVLILLDSLFD
jgi:hypothetical protein